MRTIKRDVVGAFIFTADNKILLGKSKDGNIYPGKWIVPGGGVEAGETKLQALIRELDEETGLDVSEGNIEEIDLRLTGTTKKILRNSGETVMIQMNFFNFKIMFPTASADLPLKLQDDFVDAEWFPVEKLSELSLAPPSRTSLRHMGYLPG